LSTSLRFTAPPTTALSTLSLHDALPISCVESATPAAVVIHSRYHGRQAAIIVNFRLGDAMRPVRERGWSRGAGPGVKGSTGRARSEEHTSELQSRFDLVCRLLLEKKKKK